MSAITFVGEDNFSSPITRLERYSDDTPRVKVDNFDELVERADTVVIKTSRIDTLFTGLMAVDAINSKGGWIKAAVIPYLPGARQDRVNPTGDILPVAAAVAEMIDIRVFSRVVSLDPHSEVMPSYISNFSAYPLKEVAWQIPDSYAGVIAPDKGAKARAQEVAAALGVDVFYGFKTRDVSTGKLTGFGVDPLDPHNRYLVVDDICDGGGTFIGLGEKIKECGASADLYVSHGIFSKGVNPVAERYENIFTTDSRNQDEAHLLNIIPVVDNMVNFARRDI